MKAEYSYHCSNCKEMLPRVSQGACPLCGSQAVVPMGWYQLSVRERSDWLTRIRGLRHKKAPQQDAQVIAARSKGRAST